MTETKIKRSPFRRKTRNVKCEVEFSEVDYMYVVDEAKRLRVEISEVIRRLVAVNREKSRAWF